MKNLAGYRLEDARMTSRRAFLGASLVAASAAVVAGARPAYAASAATSRSVRTETHLHLDGGTEWLARAAHPVFSYYFTHTPPGQDTTNLFTGTDQSGAYHGAEIYYMLDNLYATDRPWKEADYRIADTMSDYLVNFATHGDPNGPGTLEATRRE
jgi:carboxylesterase type B